MTIRINSVSIVDEVLEKLDTLNPENITGHNFSPEEVYLCKLLYEQGLNINDIKTSFILDNELNVIMLVLSIQQDKISCNQSPTNIIERDFNKISIMPLWSESRSWIKNKGFNLDFHYDPFFKDENIKIGFMKPKTADNDNVIIEADGKTDLEAIYKVILEVLKHQKSNPALETASINS